MGINGNPINTSVMSTSISQNTTYTVPNGNYYVNCSGASWSITLPDATVANGPVVIVHEGTNLSQVYTILTQSSQTVSVSGTSYTSGQVALYTTGEAFTFIPDSTGNWTCISHLTSNNPVSAGTIQMSATSAYVFTWVGNKSIVIGDTYSDGSGNTFTVSATTNTVTGTFSGTGTPGLTGTLTRVTGTGVTPITWASRTITGVPAFGTTTTNAVTWYRNGVNATINFALVQTLIGSGVSGLGDYIFNLPAGLVTSSSISTYMPTGTLIVTQAAQGAALNSMGGVTQAASSAATLNSIAYLYTPTQVRFSDISNSVGGLASGNLGAGYFGLGQANLAFNFTITLPIAGWLP